MVVAASSASGVSSRRSGRARARRSIAGRSASNVWPSSTGTKTSVSSQSRGGQLGRRRARSGSRVTRSISAPTSASASSVPLPDPGPARDDEELRVGRPMRERRPERLGHERHDRVEQPQVRVEHLDERPPGRLARRRVERWYRASRTLASSRPQSQYSLQIASYRTRVSSPNV